MKMVCQNLLRLDNLHYHVYTYMNLSSSIKLEPFYKLHLVLLEEHCATSCLVMADCGALLSHKKRTTPMCHVEEHCYKWNLHKMTFCILVQNHYSDLLYDPLISLVVLGLLFPKMYNGICKRLFWLAFTFFQHQHSPICQLCNH